MHGPLLWDLLLRRTLDDMAGIGAVIGAGAGTAVYRGGTRVLDPRRFFQATTVVLLLFVAGLVGKATLASEAAGVFPGTISLAATRRSPRRCS